MFHLEFERTINRSPGDVFARLADIDGYRDWLPRSFIFKGGGLTRPGETIRFGTEFVDRTPFGSFHGRVTEFDPPRKIGFEQRLTRFGKPVFDARPSYVLETTSDGTRVRHIAEGELYWINTIAEPLVQRLASSERRRTIDALKKSFEEG